MDSNNIMLIGLASGAVVVAEVLGNEGNSMQLNHTRAFVQVADEQNNRMTNALVPFAPLAENDQILVSATAIEYIAVPKTALKDQYEAMVRQQETGIVVPKPSSIITSA